MMPTFLIAALQQLAQQLGFTDLAPGAPAESFLPNRSGLLAALGSPAARTAKVTAYLGQVQARWSPLEADGTIAKLGNVRSLDGTMKTDLGVVQPLAGLPQNDVAAFYDLFALDLAGENANRLGRDLVVGTKLVVEVTDTAAHAADAILNLRRLDDVLVRVLAAKNAAAITSTGLERVLAMYRTEGNLDAPPSAGSLRDGIPSGTVDAVTHLNPRPDITHLVWLADPASLAGKPDAEIREFALVEWFVQIGGLDVVGMLPVPRRDNFTAWSSVNWTAAGLFPVAAVSLTAARTRWDNLLGTMELSRPSAGGMTAVMVVPKDPLLLISGILQESVVFQRRLERVEDLLTCLPAPHSLAPLTPGISYLRYHAGVDQFRAILVSAAVVASGTSGPTYAALRSAIRSDAILAGRVDALRPTISALAIPDLLAEWPTFEDWLCSGDHMALLSGFVEQEPAGKWNSWKEHRGNLSRYNRLLEYYGRVMA